MAKFGSNYSALAHHFMYNDDYSECYGNRMYSEHNRLYSYGSHFQIAEKLEVKGKKVILVTNKTASNTTSKQMYCLRNAIPFDWAVFNVNSMTNHKENISDWFAKIEYFQNKWSRAKSKKEYYKNEIKSLIATIVEYKELFDVKYRFNKAEKSIISELDMESLSDLIADRTKRIKQNDKAKKKRATVKALIDAKNELVDWLEGSIKYCNKQPYNAPIYLRVNKNEEVVETSTNLDVPIRESKILFDRIMKGKDIKGFKIGYYTVLELTEDILTVGCHNIPMSEVKRVGSLL